MSVPIKVKEDVYKALKELGLAEQEINLYAVSLKLGPAPISKIAEDLGISRPNAYKLFEDLERRGLARFSTRKKFARDFVVEAPNVILEKIREKQAGMQQVEHTLVTAMAELMSFYGQGDLPTKISVLEGEEQWKKIFFQVLDESKDAIDFFGSADAFIGLISWQTEREWIKRRVALGIQMNSLLTPGKDAETLRSADAIEMRTTRLFTGTIPFVTGFMLYANKVIIWQPEAPLAVLMEDEYIVAMLRSMFAWTWERSA